MEQLLVLKVGFKAILLDLPVLEAQLEFIPKLVIRRMEFIPKPV
jgi:hypothetical protein